MADSETGLHMHTGGRELFKLLENSLAVCIRSLKRFIPFDLEISFLGVKPKKIIGAMS